MLFIRQFYCLNINGAKKLSGNICLITNSSRFCTVLQPKNRLNSTSQFKIKNQSSNQSLNSHNSTGFRCYYRNYEHHPSRIVRAYRQARTWLTDHFYIADRRFENIYSFTFLVTFAVVGITVAYLNLGLGGEAGGYDVDRTQKPKSNDK